MFMAIPKSSYEYRINQPGNYPSNFPRQESARNDRHPSIPSKTSDYNASTAFLLLLPSRKDLSVWKKVVCLEASKALRLSCFIRIPRPDYRGIVQKECNGRKVETQSSRQAQRITVVFSCMYGVQLFHTNWQTTAYYNNKLSWRYCT